MAEETGKPEETNPKDAKAPKVALVRMVRSEEAFDAPHVADVHPDEVSNYAKGGWIKA